MLYILYVLQWYWFLLIAKIALKVAKGEKDAVKDTRSDDEESEGEQDVKPQSIARKKKSKKA